MVAVKEMEGVDSGQGEGRYGDGRYGDDVRGDEVVSENDGEVRLNGLKELENSPLLLLIVVVRK